MYFLPFVDYFSWWMWVYTLCEKSESLIKMHITRHYFPQQNGIVERRNSTIINMEMSLLKGRNITGVFYGEAVRHAM
ncbi:hypothetical protein LXL04_003670 [Taraxacum kok-saghyz]